MPRKTRNSTKTLVRRQPKRSTLSNRADRMWSALIRARGYCELPAPGGCGGMWQGAHVIGRRHRGVRWNLENGLCLDRDCHVYWTHHPEGFVLAVQEKWPGRYERMWALAQQGWDKDIGAVLERLKVSA